MKDIAKKMLIPALVSLLAAVMWMDSWSNQIFLVYKSRILATHFGFHSSMGAVSMQKWPIPQKKDLWGITFLRLQTVLVKDRNNPPKVPDRTECIFVLNKPPNEPRSFDGHWEDGSVSVELPYWFVVPSSAAITFGLQCLISLGLCRLKKRRESKGSKS